MKKMKKTEKLTKKVKRSKGQKRRENAIICNLVTFLEGKRLQKGNTITRWFAMRYSYL